MSALRRYSFAITAAVLLAFASPANAADAVPSRPFGEDLLNPQAGQFDFGIENLSGFIGPGSSVRVREFQREGTGLHFPALGINTVQLPSLDLTYWFDRLDAINFQFRYFDVGGNHVVTTPCSGPIPASAACQSGPVLFNGSSIIGGQTLRTDPSIWLSLAFHYERRLTPLFEAYQPNWPPALRDWDVRARIGIEFTYLDFTINGGHARVTRTSKGEETKEDFFHQELPIPTIGLEALRRINENFTFDTSFKGNWINRWNSLRNEGGTVWLSQNGVEGHFRVLYTNPQWLETIHPMIGFALYYYSQVERSTEDGNFIRWFTYGPEFGVTASY